MSKTVLTCAGLAAPAIYFALIAAGGMLFPGYDHMTQMVSELGGPDAPLPAIFNAGLMLAGGLTVLAGGALFSVCRRLGGSTIPGLLAALAIAVFGVSIVIGGIYPLPDERHLAWGMGFAIQIAPLLTLWALWPVVGLPRLKAFLAAVFIAVNALLAVMFGIGDLVDGSNFGLWQRAYGLAMFLWIGVISATLARRDGPARAQASVGLEPAILP